jgi:hypothetical protein
MNTGDSILEGELDSNSDDWAEQIDAAFALEDDTLSKSLIQGDT